MTPINRREFVQHIAAASLAAGVVRSGRVAEGCVIDDAVAHGDGLIPIIDTHQHLWDLKRIPVHWVENAAPILRRSYITQDYLEATRGLNVTKAIYMEVDVKPHLHVAEVERITELCKSAEHPTVAAVIGGRPNSSSFAAYAREMASNPYVKGVRQVLHGGATPRRFCLQKQFVESMHLLGELGLSYDLCLRPGELGDAVPLVDQCPETVFIVDHCGNADPKAFSPSCRPANTPPSHDPDQWKRDIAALAKRQHVICKISGVVAKVPKSAWNPDLLAPIVNHCLDEFGPDRVVFGGDWPVCLIGAELAEWVTALRQIIRTRPETEQRKLLHDNAQRIYRLG